MKERLGHELRKRQKGMGVSQVVLARRLKSSQSRVAKMEAVDGSVSVDLLMRGLILLGATTKDIARAIERPLLAAWYRGGSSGPKSPPLKLLANLFDFAGDAVAVDAKDPGDVGLAEVLLGIHHELADAALKRRQIRERFLNGDLSCDIRRGSRSRNVGRQLHESVVVGAFFCAPPTV